MGLLTQPPTLLKLTGLRRANGQIVLRDNELPAIYQGDYIRYTRRVYDRDGNPFNLGPTADPLWQPRAQIRRDNADNSPLLASFTTGILDGPLGDVEWWMMPDSSKLLRLSNAHWDFEIENLADTIAPVGAIVTVWAGPALIARHVTKA